MRLTDEDVGLIIASLEPFLVGYQAELRLFGSRANDTRKGGDIVFGRQGSI